MPYNNPFQMVWKQNGIHIAEFSDIDILYLDGIQLVMGLGKKR